jgi:TetR/AcrR family transcriptional regulator
MAGSGVSRGRAHDARGAQAAILDAAEAAFAASGFAGARIDAIAEASGYNKSLIFHYFDDKLGLYSAVLKRADDQGHEMQAEISETMLAHPEVATDPRAFRAFMDRTIRTIFDFFIANPRLLRIVAWEEAAGWTTLSKIASVFDQRDAEQIAVLLEQAQQAGILRREISPNVTLIIAENICRTYLTSLPIYQMAGLTVPNADTSSAENIARARDQIVAFILHGMVADLPNADSKHPGDQAATSPHSDGIRTPTTTAARQ